MQNPPPAEPTWEELFDSGQLEQQISQINFGQHVPSPPLQLNQQRPQQGLIMTPQEINSASYLEVMEQHLECAHMRF